MSDEWRQREAERSTGNINNRKEQESSYETQEKWPSNKNMV